MNNNAITPQMASDAMEVIEIVLNDLGIPEFKPSLALALDRCERFGSELPRYMDMPKSTGGFCFVDSGRIFINPALKGRAKSSVIAHELTHRLCFSERYEYLNCDRYAEYDREDFLELIAYGVEWMWRRLASGNMKKPARFNLMTLSH